MVRLSYTMSKQEETLGELVARLRQQAGLSIRGLAATANVDIANISRMERGESIPKPATLQRLAAALNANPADLFAAAGYADKRGLPSFQPYLRTKYGHLPPEKLIELTAYFDRIEAEYGKKNHQDNE